jgi:hypothetical protein
MPYVTNAVATIYWEEHGKGDPLHTAGLDRRDPHVSRNARTRLM